MFNSRRYCLKIFNTSYIEENIIMTPKEIPFFGIRAGVLRALFADPEWRAKLEKAESDRERKEVIFAFARSKGYKVPTVKISP